MISTAGAFESYVYHMKVGVPNAIQGAPNVLKKTVEVLYRIPAPAPPLFERLAGDGGKRGSSPLFFLGRFCETAVNPLFSG